MKQVKVNKTTDDMLTAISKKRKASNSPNRTKQDIIADLVSKQYKKEFTQVEG